MDDDCCGGYSAVVAVSCVAVVDGGAVEAVVAVGHAAGNHQVNCYDV